MKKTFSPTEILQALTFIHHNFFKLDIVPRVKLVLVITCLGGQFEINCLNTFLKILKLSEYNEENFKIFKYHEGDLSEELPEPNM